MKLRPLLRTLRAGDTRGRMAALRASRQALAVAMTGSALRTGVLRELTTAATLDELAERRGWSRQDHLEALLQVYKANGLVEEAAGRWRTTRAGRRILDDDVVSATYEGFGTYHTGLYRDIEQQLTGAVDRQDIERDGELIARLSRFMDEFVLAELDRVVGERQPRRVLDVGCGAAAHLRHVLTTVPGARGVGVETDPQAAALARETVRIAGLADRAEIVEEDVRRYLAVPGERFDLALLANIVYYVPRPDRAVLLSTLAERLQPGGRLLVISTALTDDSFSRHFDLLLRTQGAGMELPDLDELADQLRQAGLVPDAPRRIAPGEPLTAVVARKP